MGKQWKHWKTLLSWIPTSLQLVTSALKLKMLAPWKKSCGQPRQHIKKQRYNLANRGPSSQSYGFSNSRVQRWELDLKKGWESKNWCICTRVLEKTLESPLDHKEIQPVHPKENQSWIFIGRTDAETEASVFGHLTHWKRPWCWERLKEVGVEDDRGCDGWTASPTK